MLGLGVSIKLIITDLRIHKMNIQFEELMSSINVEPGDEKQKFMVKY